MKELELGEAASYGTLPAEVEVERKRYYLMDMSEGLRLVSRRCPHAGATVELEDGELECPMHGWTFERDTGRCHNVPSARLAQYEVVVRDGKLFALMD